MDVEDSEVDERLTQIADSSRPFEAKEGKAENGDRVVMSYLGKIDGEAFDGGADEKRSAGSWLRSVHSWL